MLIRWSGHIKASVTTDQMMAALDWMPTLTCWLAGRLAMGSRSRSRLVPRLCQDHTRWLMPPIPYHWTVLTNRKRDFEQTFSDKAGMSFGGTYNPTVAAYICDRW